MQASKLILTALLLASGATASAANEPRTPRELLGEIAHKIEISKRRAASPENGWWQVSKLFPQFKEPGDRVYDETVREGDRLYKLGKASQDQELSAFALKFAVYRARVFAATAQPIFLYPYDWDHRKSAHFLSFVPVIHLTHSLIVCASYHLRMGNPEEAREILFLAERLGRDLASDGVLVQAMIGLSTVRKAQQAHLQWMDELRKGAGWQATLSEVKKLRTGARMEDSFRNTMDFEFYWCQAEMESPDHGKRTGPLPSPAATPKDISVHGRLFLDYHNALSLPRPRQELALAKVRKSAAKMRADDPELISTITRDYESGQRVCRFSDLMREAIITETALYGFRTKKGKFPTSLDELVPEWLPALPQDPRNPGSRLTYRAEKGSFRLTAPALANDQSTTRVELAKTTELGTVILHEPKL